MAGICLWNSTHTATDLVNSFRFLRCHYVVKNEKESNLHFLKRTWQKNLINSLIKIQFPKTLSVGRCLLIPKYFNAVYDEADLSKGCWNPKRKLGVTTHLLRIIKQQNNVWDFFFQAEALFSLKKCMVTPQFGLSISLSNLFSCSWPINAISHGLLYKLFPFLVIISL